MKCWLMFFHNWSDWSDAALSKGKTCMCQARICKKCNKCQVRFF